MFCHFLINRLKKQVGNCSLHRLFLYPVHRAHNASFGSVPLYKNFVQKKKKKIQYLLPELYNIYRQQEGSSNG